MTAAITEIPSRLRNVSSNDPFVAGADDIDFNKPASTGTTGAYPYNGMGRVVIPKKIVNSVNTLTHEAFEDSEGNDRENTIYVIQYDFTLGEDITVPANCVLEFDGGSVVGSHSITVQSNQIKSIGKCFGSDVTLLGIKQVKAEWFGITPESDDISVALNAAVSHIPSGCAIVFSNDRYKTSATLNFVKNDIIGNPEFYATSANITCVKISNANENRFEFRVDREYPSIWANENSIGVLFENCYRSTFIIQYIDHFTYGLVCKDANGDGFAWNEFYIKSIRNAFRGFTVQSANGGWLNANNVYGTEFPMFSGHINTDDASGRGYGIGFVSDGIQGSNSWNFVNFQLEGYNNYDVVPYDIVNIYDYCNEAYISCITFDNCRIEMWTDGGGYVARIADIGLSNVRFVNPHKITGTTKLLVDQNGNEIMPGYIYPIAETKDKYLIQRINVLDNTENDLQVLYLNQYVTKFMLSKGAKFIGFGKNSGISTRFAEWGKPSKGIAISNFENVPLCFIATAGMQIMFVDKDMNVVDPDDVEWIEHAVDNDVKFRRVFVSGYTKTLDSNPNHHEYNICVKNAGNAKYMLVGIDGYNTTKPEYLEVYKLKTSDNPIIENILGRYGEAYAHESAPDVLRTRFDAGDEYYDITNDILHKFIKGGSYGTTDATLTGNIGDAEIVCSNVERLLIGDKIKIGSDVTEYIIKDIDVENSKIKLNKALVEAASSSSITFVAPVVES